MSNWYIGQPIVAIEDGDGFFKKGDTFTIQGLRNTSCLCKCIDIDIGMKMKYNGYFCDVCGHQEEVTPGCIMWFEETAFAPLDTDISELTEILENANTVTA